MHHMPQSMGRLHSWPSIPCNLPTMRRSQKTQLHQLAEAGFIDLLRKKRVARIWRGTVPKKAPLIVRHTNDFNGYEARGARLFTRELRAIVTNRQPGGHGPDLDLRVTTKSGKRRKPLVSVPSRGISILPEARIITPGNPFRSTLYYRVSILGRGRMPHIGSDAVDRDGVWFASELD